MKLEINIPIHLGDGAYLKFTGYSFEFMANSHVLPTDVVSVDIYDVPNLIKTLQDTIEKGSE